MKTLELKQMESVHGGWRLFGRQDTGSIGINEIICGPGSGGVRIFYDVYFMGIVISSGFEDICL